MIIHTLAFKKKQIEPVYKLSRVSNNVSAVDSNDKVEPGLKGKIDFSISKYLESIAAICTWPILLRVRV